MPEISAIYFGLLALFLVGGLVLGWILRGSRCAQEKIAVSAGWQDQIDAQQSENDRLADQNTSLMDQISQYQASNKDSQARAKELSDALKETFERRDELQRQIKDIRGNLEVAVAQRDRLQTDIKSRDVRGEATDSALKEKDEKIFRLSRELSSWQKRVPPLVERFRERDNEAKSLEEELRLVTEQIAALQSITGSENTRIEPVSSENLPDGMDASNEPHTETSAHRVVEFRDPPAEGIDDEAAGEEDLTPEMDDSVNDSMVVADAHDSTVVADAQDDLKKIKGVGPAIEKTLNDLGIHRFNQIAEMSEYDIDRVAQQLKGFRSRIYREDWIGQARILQYRKNNDLS